LDYKKDLIKNSKRLKTQSLKTGDLFNRLRDFLIFCKFNILKEDKTEKKILGLLSKTEVKISFLVKQGIFNQK
jgi:hypothetical protein